MLQDICNSFGLIVDVSIKSTEVSIIVQSIFHEPRYMRLKIIEISIIFTLVTGQAIADVQPGVVAPPDVRVVDYMSVNMATGQVDQSVETVSIGGELGLSHQLSIDANYLNVESHRWYRDKFALHPELVMLAPNSDGKFDTVPETGVLDFNIVPIPRSPSRQVPAMRVFAFFGSQEFAYKDGDDYVDQWIDLDITDGPDYTYEPIGDKRHSLRVLQDKSLVWRNPDGMEVEYKSVPTGGYAAGEVITYPNGFKIYVESDHVWTNTGFLLKYKTLNDNSAWSGNVNAISALNLAFENCDPDGGCSTQGWPNASFSWPTSVPNSLYSDGAENIFTVTDQIGRVTELTYKTSNACYFRQPEIEGISELCENEYPGKYKYVPRLARVKSSASNVVDFEYEYENEGEMFEASPGSGPGVHLSIWYWRLSNKVGRVSKATRMGYGRIYGKPFSGSQYGYNSVRENSDYRVQLFNYHPGKLESVEDKKRGVFYYEENSRNFITKFHPYSGPWENYNYDDAEGGRGNLVSITANNEIIQKADYPSDCNDTNFRYCNKPLWIEDANGKRTDYAYHEASGQVKSVTYPAIKIQGSSVRPKTNYVWNKYYATFFHRGENQSTPSMHKSSDGIYLLQDEWYCRTSAALTDSVGCSAGPTDLVKKHYYYGPQDGSEPNNLLLRGESITAANYAELIETRVTCYEYDKLGNKIGTSLPKGNDGMSSASACP